jgi:DNA-binding transcriptional LysR family regulator
MPTDTARELINHAQSMALAAEAFARAASAQANVPGGTVRVTRVSALVRFATEDLFPQTVYAGPDSRQTLPANRCRRIPY